MSISKKEKYRKWLDGYDIFLERCNSVKHIRILSYIAGKITLDSLNCSYVTQKELSNKFKVDQPNISKSLGALVEHGAIKKIGKRIMVNPEMIFVGSEGNHERAIAIWRKN